MVGVLSLLLLLLLLLGMLLRLEIPVVHSGVGRSQFSPVVARGFLSAGLEVPTLSNETNECVDLWAFRQIGRAHV